MTLTPKDNPLCFSECAHVNSTLTFQKKGKKRKQKIHIYKYNLTDLENFFSGCKYILQDYTNVSVMQAVSISSVLKVAVALSQSVWACAGKHCSAALWREKDRRRGVLTVGCSFPAIYSFFIPCVREHLEDKKLWSAAAL